MQIPTQPKIQRGQVWDVEFDPQVGAEISKVRPAVVMNVPNVGRLPLHIVVPITTGSPTFSRYFWMVPLAADPHNGLTHDSFADTFQIKSLSAQRFVSLRGQLTTSQMDQIAATVALCIGYTPPKPTT